MSDPVAEGPDGVPAGVRGVTAVVRASLVVSPRPTAWLIRAVFAWTGRQQARALRARRPAGVADHLDERYDARRDARLDVFHPRSVGAGERLPALVWVHGGAFVAGDKREMADYLRLVATSGLTVVGVDYTRAPGGRHPTPVRQVMAALRHLQVHADRLHLDPTRIVLAGDSAGAHIAAQAAAAVTSPAYAARLGVRPAITSEHLRAVVLCCGIFDLAPIAPGSPFEPFFRAVAWAYSGTRDPRRREWFTSTTAIADHVTGAYPPTFLTVGNADPLAQHTHALAAALRARGVDTDVLAFPDGHEPALGHEYQFDLGLDASHTALRRLTRFVHAHTGVRHDPGST